MTEAAPTTPTPQPSPPAPSPSPSPAPAPPEGSPTTISRPEYVPEAFWDATTNAVKAPEFTAHIGELAAAKAAQAARIAARPEKPDGYELKFADGFTPAIPVEFKADDPRVAPLRAWAHETGLDQAGFSKLLEIEAGRVAAEHKADEAAHAAEMKKLGANGTARVTAAKTFLAGILGTDGAQAMIERMVLASDVEALEKLQQAFSTQGGGNITNGGRTTAPPPEKPLAQKLWPLRQAAS